MIIRLYLYFAAHAGGFSFARFWRELSPLGKFVLIVLILTVLSETLRLMDR